MCKIFIWTCLLLHIHTRVAEALPNDSQWWRNVNNVTDYMHLDSQRQIINSSLNQTEHFWQNKSIKKTFNSPENKSVDTANPGQKLVRKVKKTFKSSLIKQHNDKPIEIIARTWHQNYQDPNFENEKNTIKWDDDHDISLLTTSNSKSSKNLKNFEAYASVMPLPPPNSLNNFENSNTLSSQKQFEPTSTLFTSSQLKFPKTDDQNEYFDTEPISHNLPISNNLIKTKSKENSKSFLPIKSSISTFLSKPKINNMNNLIKTVDYKMKINHSYSDDPLVANILKNNPYAIPLGKKTYNVYKSTSPKPFTLKVSNGNTGYPQEKYEFTTSDSTSVTAFKPKYLDRIQFKAIPSKQEFVWGKRVRSIDTASVARINSPFDNSDVNFLNNERRSNRHSNLNSNKFLENEENEDNLNDQEEKNDVTDDQLDKKYENRMLDVKNDDFPQFELVDEKNPSTLKSIKKELKQVKSLPIQIINWRHAITHRKKGKDILNISSRSSNLNNFNHKNNGQENKRDYTRKIDKQLENAQPLAFNLPRHSSEKLTSKSKSARKLVNQNALKSTRQLTESIKVQTKGKLANNLININSFTTKSLKTSSVKKKPAADRSSKVVENKNNDGNLDRWKFNQNLETYSDQITAPFKPALKNKNLLDNAKFNQKNTNEQNKFNKKSLNLVNIKNEEEETDKNNDLVEESVTKLIPSTSFKCSDQDSAGYFGDVETDCEVFHICQADNRKDSFFCPPGTAFNQQLLVCDWKNNVDCSKSTRYFSANAEIFGANSKETDSIVNYSTEENTDEVKKINFNGLKIDAHSTCT